MESSNSGNVLSSESSGNEEQSEKSKIYSSLGDRDLHTYDSLEVPNTNKTVMPIKPKSSRRLKIYIGMLLAVILLLGILLAVFVYLFVSCKTEDSKQEARLCPEHTEIENGKIINSTGFNHGDVIEIECDNRSKLAKSKKITCLSSGKWSDVLKCVPKSCENFVVIDNMQIVSEANDTAVGAKIILKCKDGYEIHGNKTIMCQSDESWSENPICKAIDCGFPGNITNAELRGLSQTTFNSTFSVACNEGHDLRGSKTVTCTNAGVWDELPTCEIVYCGLPDIPTHGSISSITGTSFNSTVSIRCDESFLLNGTDVLMCQANGKWTKGPTCHDYGNYPMDCVELQSQGKTDDGVYNILLWNSAAKIQVYCDMTTAGGGWTVFQHRYEGSVDFYRSFVEYERGFGDFKTEFWLGLKYIQEMTNHSASELRIELQAADDTRGYESFPSFTLIDGTQYRLDVGAPTNSSNIKGDYFHRPHNGYAFSTFDRDLDTSSDNCAVKFHGAWWYYSCYGTNLNGQYLTPGTRDFKGMNYAGFSPESLKAVE